ncbi:MAG: 1-acyl-sn-glycerol-3-phosphate acyltransferase [Thermoanaerobaculia bacterium]|nr:MAG: 1-acyl-sn-glycerol-3-phosphate acyltransferase [Thermoanaerobaculia bacterium]
MISLRAAARLTGAVVTTVPCYLAALVGGWLLWFSPRTCARWHGRVFQAWSRTLCRILAVRVGVTGPAPEPPFVLVSNHVSYLDILVLGTRLPCVYVAKAEIDEWPVFGAMCRAVNTIFIDRKAKRDVTRVMKEMEGMLAAHQGIVVFAEGTSGAGDAVLPFRSSLLDLPARLGRPVHWAAISYGLPEGSPPAHLSVTWWGDMPLLPHVRALARLDRIDASVVFGAESLHDGDRKLLAERLHRAISAAFSPMVESAEVERLLALRESDPDAVPPILRPRRGPG